MILCSSCSDNLVHYAFRKCHIIGVCSDLISGMRSQTWVTMAAFSALAERKVDRHPF